MKRIIPLSLITLTYLGANEITLEQIGVEASALTEVSQNAKTSADIAEALSKSVPSIDMSRRSGIANDIFIRGQKRDNISIEIDGTKVCGACPNRMDPPVSHVLASQIEDIKVIEGPYDVETFGTMSGGLKIKTKQPSATPTGELNFGFGSWGYNKVGTTLSGGNDTVRVLLSASTESSDQYEDGDGNTLAEQTKLNAPAGNQYQPQYEDMKAYQKKSVNAKMFVNVTQDQELQLSFTQNKSDDILYANSAMDAIYDDSDIYSIAYNIKDMTESYKNVNLQYYYSRVVHPMSTEYRKVALMDPTKNTTAQLKTTMQGVKLKNDFDFDGLKLLIGLDGSKRTWDGFYKNNVSGMVMPVASIDNATTKNMALFTKLEKSFGGLDLSFGARYDTTKITNEATHNEPDYNSLSANLLTTYNLSQTNKIFLGFGQAYRVPDGRELYFTKGGNLSGNPQLDQTRNQEIDLGYELKNDFMKFKIKGFYSMLENYIYLQKGGSFQNIDATIYGAELSSSVYATDMLSIDLSASYKVGEKDEALAGQTDKDLADIAPLRGKLGVTYEYMTNSLASLDVQYSDKWDKYDSDNGEQALDSWTTLNAKVKHAFNKHIDLTLGVNNIMDETYAQSNTYVDLTLLAAGAETMLLNEPGRYVYTNLDIKF
ncbi:MAG: TonB-dependent receptor [Helicobacteraceae bacterium]|nr:TonB-dependent receptor [Helicobacteraceae bacterium]